MARKSIVTTPIAVPTFVNFDYENRTYQIDPDMRKVYRRFVEIETSKAAAILAVWRSEIVAAT